jgi:hypothetical protein
MPSEFGNDSQARFIYPAKLPSVGIMKTCQIHRARRSPLKQFFLGNHGRIYSIKMEE